MAWPTKFARLKPGLNHVLAYGQSLSTGWEGWPALSTTPTQGALMLGDSVRPVSEAEPDWQPVGLPALRSLVATVQDIASGKLLSPATVAALPPGALALGETALEGAIAEWRARGANDPAHRILASACGVGGRALEALSKGARPELFNRLRACVRQARKIAGADTGPMEYGIAALLFLHGEHNSWGLGGTADRAGYKGLLMRFYADFVADIAAATAGQALPPAMFLYQTGGAYASADNAVAQAQLDVALELPLCILVAPTYPVTDKGGHLDANGYRWLGAQFGKVMHRVLTLDEAWLPLHPLRARREGATVALDFHVPVEPLAWGRPFAGQARVDVAQKGFCVHDSAGDVAVTDAVLDGARGVQLHLARVPAGNAVVRYAAAAQGGLGSLHDSDSDPSALRYVLDTRPGTSPGVDVMGIAGRLYDLRNWCVAFTLPLESEANSLGAGYLPA